MARKTHRGRRNRGRFGILYVVLSFLLIAAALIAGSCDRSVRTLSKSQNQYCMANAAALDLSQELIHCEESLSAGLRPYL